MGCSPPDSSVHGILQTRVLEWLAISFSRGASRLERWSPSCIAGRFFYYLSHLASPIKKKAQLYNCGGRAADHLVVFHRTLRLIEGGDSAVLRRSQHSGCLTRKRAQEPKGQRGVRQAPHSPVHLNLRPGQGRPVTPRPPLQGELRPP